MNIAEKKIELISWLTRLNDENIINKIESLRKSSVSKTYKLRMPKNAQELQDKLDRSDADIIAGRIHSQKEVEDYFKSKTGQ